MRWNKKGALELSITAIVVLIIAITVLGLAIFFIKNLFGESTELLTGQLAKIKEQLRKNLEETGELVVMSKGTELEVKRGEKLKFHIGVRNSGGADQCYRVAMVCKRPFTPTDLGGECTMDYETDVIVGGIDGTGQRSPGENWFPSMLEEIPIGKNAVEISPAELQIATASPDTYLMEMQVYQGTEDCDFEAIDPWQSKRFHIKIS